MTQDIEVGGHRIAITLSPRAGNGIIYAHYRLPDGTRRRISSGTSNPEEAEHFLEWIVANRLQADVLRAAKRASAAAATAKEDAADPRLSALFDYYLKTYAQVKNLAPRTVERHQQVLRDLELYLRSRRVGRASQLSRAIVDGWAADLKGRNAAPKTLHNALSTLRGCLNACVEAGLLKESPIRKWLLPSVPEPEIQPLEPGDLRSFLDAVQTHSPQVYNVVRWIAFTGCRPSDAKMLRWRQIDLTNRTIERAQVKTKRLLRYQFGEQALAALLDEKKRGYPTDDVVFRDPHGDPFSRNYLIRAVTRACDRAGMRRVTLKDLRHTFGYCMANYAGCPLPQLQVLMGHSDIAMTMRYVRSADAAPALAAFEKMTKKAGHTPGKPKK